MLSKKNFKIFLTSIVANLLAALGYWSSLNFSSDSEFRLWRHLLALFSTIKLVRVIYTEKFAVSFKSNFGSDKLWEWICFVKNKIVLVQRSGLKSKRWSLGLGVILGRVSSVKLTVEGGDENCGKVKVNGKGWWTACKLQGELRESYKTVAKLWNSRRVTLKAVRK